MNEDIVDNKMKNYRFKGLNVYSSTEWLANNAKKYRQIFDQDSTSYVYAELSFYNKLYDEENWDINVQLKCFEVQKKKEVCSLKFSKTVSKHDSIAYIREGWGNRKDGSFWKKGTYYWEAWIEDEKVSTKYFYVEDYSFDWDIFEIKNLEFNSMRLYEGSFDDVPQNKRTYLKAFSNEDTRYIYSELIFTNKNVNKTNYSIELFLKYYNQARELKGEVSKIVKVNKNDVTINITAGWGSNIKGSWRMGEYTAELILLDRLVAQLPFEIAEEDEEGTHVLKLTKGDKTIHLESDGLSTANYDEVQEKFSSLIGLESIKKQISDHASYIKYLQLRTEKGLKEVEDINIHSVFTGNPGTGKTTVAKMMGTIYKNMGLLSKGHVHEVDRSDIVGEYIGQTAPKVKKAIIQARGGVLFIDEAYSLARTNDDSKDFGREAIEMLVKEMSSKNGDLAIIVAGYPKEMDHFINSNPGLKSRFKHFFDFPDYLPQELIQIADHAAKEHGVYFSKSSKDRLNELIIEAYRNRGTNFGNARFVHDLVEKAKVHLGLRVMKTENPNQLTTRSLNQILLEDVANINLNLKKSKPFIPVDKDLLASSLSELNSLIGMDNIKKEIHELVDIVNFHKQNGKDVLNNFFLHTLFIGNPGTGKTTVARILTKIYKALGLLERGHIIETDRQGLVAGYLGQTAIKTNERINEAFGGVLFIDEAYALSNFNGLQGDYGNESIQTILKRMEDNRGEFFVFAAGYPGNMDVFLKANPGLRSRFDKILKFEDYSANELLTIADSMLQENGYVIDSNAKSELFELLIDLHSTRNQYFGNAREVRKIVHDVIKNQNLRLAHDKNSRADQVNKVIIDDLKHLDANSSSDLFSRESIGFKK